MSKDARATDTAYLSAEEKMADLKNGVYTSTPVSGNDKDTLENIIFTRAWTVNQSNYILQASITVSWESLKGTRQITFSGAIN